MPSKVLFWSGLGLFGVGQFFLIGLVEFNRVVGDKFIAYFIVVLGLSFIGASNLLKRNSS
ncbi:hypothetical protein SAMN04488072_104116 [Lentibacillus halodurans]|uniref:Uncharacterized protein n=1 Tax=Lentibacillus halodurans TaxID=237679 RepID=A0A1I0X3D2_9BACI|nr:hypothetical protein [Lentibacillus halodurans]SFA95334.1 hypothetical protein SAMN04488072_104116 [Lentibacillus halodurans]